MGVSIISEKLEDIRNYLDVEVHPVVSPDRWDVYAALCDMVDDTIAMLKAQEPRVITAEQLEDWLEPVYLEDIFSGARWALIADFSANWFTFKVTKPGFLKEEEFHTTEYGRRWRCWNKKPTKEQREAVEWE